jgi:hypothetical protein
VRRELAGRCFICELRVRAPPRLRRRLRDCVPAAFPDALRLLLVAPKEYRERVVEDFSADEYLALQAVVHRVGRAICRAVPTERLYVLSLGSGEGNSRVHWHPAPLPPGVPFELQQLAALDTDLGLVLDGELEELAGGIRAALAETGKEPPGA